MSHYHDVVNQLQSGKVDSRDLLKEKAVVWVRKRRESSLRVEINGELGLFVEMSVTSHRQPDDETGPTAWKCSRPPSGLENLNFSGVARHRNAGTAPDLTSPSK